MFKKLVIVGLGLLLVLGLLYGRNTIRYIQTGVKSAQDWVKKQESPEFKLEKAKQQIDELEKDIIDAKQTAARKEIERDRIAKRVLDLDEQLVVHRDEMLILKNDLEANRDSYQYDGEYYTATDLRDDLEIRLANYQTLKDTVASCKEELATRNEALREAMAQIRMMENNKQKYELEVAKLEARLESIRVKEAASTEFKIVDSNSADIRETLDEVEVIAATQEKMLDNHSKTGRIPVSKPKEKTDILERVTQELNPNAETVVNSAK